MNPFPMNKITLSNTDTVTKFISTIKKNAFMFLEISKIKTKVTFSFKKTQS